MEQYHTAANGQEALGERMVEHPDTSHCLIGWVIRMTPGAVEAEDGGHLAFENGGDLEPLDLAQWLLVQGGHLPIPLNLVYGSVDEALRFIRGRAAEYRQRKQETTNEQQITR
jgi:hypothetical protein